MPASNAALNTQQTCENALKVQNLTLLNNARYEKEMLRYFYFGGFTPWIKIYRDSIIFELLLDLKKFSHFHYNTQKAIHTLCPKFILN